MTYAIFSLLSRSNFSALFIYISLVIDTTYLIYDLWLLMYRKKITKTEVNNGI